MHVPQTAQLRYSGVAAAIHSRVRDVGAELSEKRFGRRALFP